MPEPCSQSVRDYIRVFARSKCDRRLNISFHQSGKTHLIPARCTNVGVGGFCARVSQTLERDQSVSIEFLLQGFPVTLQATVRHSSGFDTGFQFIAPGEDERRAIAQFFMEGVDDSE